MSSVTQFHQIKLAFVPTRMAKYVHTNVANVRAWGPPCDRAQTEHDGQSCTFILGGYLRLGISTSRRAQVAAFNGTTTIPLKKFHLWNCIWTFLISDLNWWKTKMKKLGFGEWNSMGRRWKRGNLVEGGGSPGDGCCALRVNAAGQAGVKPISNPWVWEVKVMRKCLHLAFFSITIKELLHRRRK